MSYKGKWYPKNPSKYEGNSNVIIYRSLWERQAFRWCDQNPDIRSWGSETVVIPYLSKVDGKKHRYYVDLKINFNSGKTVLVEIKPKKHTISPKKQTRTTPKYLREVFRYGMNTSKWEYAEEYAKDRGWEFEIWTEETLKSLGIKILKQDKYHYGRHKTKKQIRENSKKGSSKRNTSR